MGASNALEFAAARMDDWSSLATTIIRQIRGWGPATLIPPGTDAKL
jgi:hypothetical protein